MRPSFLLKRWMCSLVAVPLLSAASCSVLAASSVIHHPDGRKLGAFHFPSSSVPRGTRRRIATTRGKVTSPSSKLPSYPSDVDGATSHRRWSSSSTTLTTRTALSAAEAHDAPQQTEMERLMTHDALNMVNAAIQAVDPHRAVQKFVSTSNGDLLVGHKSYSCTDFSNIIVVAFGKAATRMAQAVVEGIEKTNFNSLPLEGVVITKDDHVTAEQVQILSRHNIAVQEASHPVPDDRSVQGARAIRTLLEKADARTLVVCGISGGGSALYCEPHASLQLHDLQDTNTLLLQSGMTIQQMNVVRKRLERGKGGRLLAEQVYPATCATLILSDVLGDPLDLIASGPTVPDSSNWQEAYDLCQRFQLLEKLPGRVRTLLQRGVAGEVEDTPDPQHPAFGNQQTFLVGNNQMAVSAAAREAERLGYHPIILGTSIQGEAQHVAGVYTAMAQHLVEQRDNDDNEIQSDDASSFFMAPLSVALVAGGETTVTLPLHHEGKGGRNQELALAAALHLRGLRNVVLASVGTDGTDGPTDAAGAVVDGGTVDRLFDANPGDDSITLSAQEALDRHDAYHYLCQSDASGHSPLIRTGPTGTNVADVCVVLVR